MANVKSFFFVCTNPDPKTFVRESEAAYSQELSQTLTDFSLPYPTCMDYRKQILCFI